MTRLIGRYWKHWKHEKPMIRCGLGFRLCEAMFQELSGAWSFGFQGEIYGGMQQVHLFAPRRLAKRSKSGANFVARAARAARYSFSKR